MPIFEQSALRWLCVARPESKLGTDCERIWVNQRIEKHISVPSRPGLLSLQGSHSPSVKAHEETPEHEFIKYQLITKDMKKQLDSREIMPLN